MKTVRVTSEFMDKYDPTRRYKPGEVVKFDDERAADMVERNLAVLLEEPDKTKMAEAPAEVKGDGLEMAETETVSTENVKPAAKPKQGGKKGR